MNTAIQCIVLLACIAWSSSAAVMKRCQCVRTNKSVKLSLIADFEEYAPRPYCNKKEVIIILKDKTKWCLDPENEFTKAVLKTMRIQRAQRANKMKNTVPEKTTASATASTTASATAPATASATSSATASTTASATVAPTS